MDRQTAEATTAYVIFGDEDPDAPPHRVVLTADHPSSRYHVPVLLVDGDWVLDGQTLIARKGLIITDCEDAVYPSLGLPPGYSVVMEHWAYDDATLAEMGLDNAFRAQRDERRGRGAQASTRLTLPLRRAQPCGGGFDRATGWQVAGAPDGAERTMMMDYSSMTGRDREIARKWAAAKHNDLAAGYVTQHDIRTARLIRDRQRQCIPVSDRQIAFALSVESVLAARA